MIKKRLIVMLLLLTNPLWTNTASLAADCQTERDLIAQCETTVQACDQALDARKKEVSLCRLGLQTSRDENTRLSRELGDANDKLSSPLRNPFLLFAIGALAGVMTVEFVRK